MIESIEIKNFQSIGFIKLTLGPGLHFIYGKEVDGDENRVGKTALIEATCHGLYGHCSRGRGEIFPGHIILCGKIQGVRFVSKQKWTKSSNTWKLSVEGESKYDGMTRCEEKMTSLIGLSYDEFMRLNFFQKKGHNLTGCKVKDRSDMAVKFLKIKGFPNLIDMLDLQIKDLKESVATKSSELESLRLTLVPESKIKDLEKQKETLSVQHAVLFTDISGQEGVTLPAQLAKLANLGRDVGNMRKVNVLRQELLRQIYNLDSIIEGGTNQETTYHEVGNELQILQGRIDNAKDRQNLIEKYELDSRLYEDLKTQWATIATRINQYKAEDFENAADEKTLKFNLGCLLEVHEKLVQVLQDEYDDLALQHASELRLVEAGEILIQQEKDELAKFTDKSKVTCPFTAKECQLLSEVEITSHRQKISDKISQMQQKTDVHKIKVSELAHLIDPALKKLIAQKEVVGFTSDKFVDLADKDVERARTLHMKPVWDGWQDDLTNMKATADARGYNKQYPLDIEAKLLELKTDQEPIASLQLRFDCLLVVRNMIQKGEEAQAEKDKVLLRLDTELKLDIKEFDKQQEEYKQLEGKVADLRQTIMLNNATLQTISERQAIIREELDRHLNVKARIENIPALQTEIENLTLETEMNKEMIKFLKSYPTYKFSKSLKILEKQANKYLKLFVNTYELKFKHYHENTTTDTVKLMWNILIKDELGEREVPPAVSGSEEDVINFATKSALQDMLDIDKQRLPWMFLDEPFSSYADAKMQKFLDYMFDMTDVYDQVFLVGHDPRIRDNLAGAKLIELKREQGKTTLIGVKQIR